MNNLLYITVFSEKEMVQSYQEQISAAVGTIDNLDDLRMIHSVVLNTLLNPGMGKKYGC